MRKSDDLLPASTKPKPKDSDREVTVEELKTPSIETYLQDHCGPVIHEYPYTDWEQLEPDECRLLFKQGDVLRITHFDGDTVDYDLDSDGQTC